MVKEMREGVAWVQRRLPVRVAATLPLRSLHTEEAETQSRAMVRQLYAQGNQTRQAGHALGEGAVKLVAAERAV